MQETGIHNWLEVFECHGVGPAVIFFCIIVDRVLEAVPEIKHE